MHWQEIYRTSIADGLGWRVVLFVSGCNHYCEGCHNPESWNPLGGKELDSNDIIKLIDYLNHDYISGLTLSGGDPLFPGNRADVLRLVQIVKGIFPQKTIWLYTGYDWEEIYDLDIMHYIDVVVDGKFDLATRDTTLAFKGSPNQRIIDVQKSLEKQEVILYDLK